MFDLSAGMRVNSRYMKTALKVHPNSDGCRMKTNERKGGRGGGMGEILTLHFKLSGGGGGFFVH